MIFAMDDDHKLTKKEKKEQRKLEWQEKAKNEVRNAKIKQFSLWGGVALGFLIVIGVLIAFVSSPSTSTPNINIAPVSSRDISTGNPKAKVTLIEYADFQCPACAAYHPVVNQLLDIYKNSVFYVYRMFPLESAHPNALISAQAAYAAYKQNAFFKYDDLLYTNQNDWNALQDPTTVFTGYAQDLKLDVSKFKADMVSSEAQKYVKDSENQALNEGVNQTPSFFINGKIIQNPNSVADFQKSIDAALNQK
jgi:protein-disulfide isomerase